MDKNQIKCPHCKKTTSVDYKCFLNVESYGSKSFIIKCDKCFKKISVEVVRDIRIYRSSVFGLNDNASLSFGE